MLGAAPATKTPGSSVREEHVSSSVR